VTPWRGSTLEPHAITLHGGTNGEGRLTAMIVRTGGDVDNVAFAVTDYAYDAAGRMTGKHYQFNSHYNYSDFHEYFFRPFLYQYTANGALEKITYPTGRRVFYCYGDDPSRPTEIRSDDSEDIADCDEGEIIVEAITYYPFGDVASMTLGNGQVQSFTRDKRYALKELKDGTSGDDDAFHDITYTYDSFGDIETIDDAFQGEGQYADHALAYDGLHQLTAADLSITAGSTPTTYTEAFAYNAAGNRTSYTKNGATAQSYTYTSGSNKLASISGGKSVSLAYDDRGSMTTYTEAASGATVVADLAYGPNGMMGTKDDYMIDGATFQNGNTVYLITMPNGEMVGKVNATLTELKIFGSDPSGNLLLEGYYTESTTQDPIIEHIYLGNRIVASVTGAGDACFIATVAYGSPLASDLNVFRAFRDRVLRRVAFGEDVIRYYYARGPAAAKWIKHHDYMKTGTRWALTIIAVPLKVLLFGRLSLLIIILLCALCASACARKLGWKRSTALVTTFSLAFSTVMVYYFFVEVPVAHASYTENAKYFYTVDHIGRPFNLRDGDTNRLLRWYEQHYAFGEIIEEATPNGDITAGAGDYIISWTPPFRFPGQYQTEDMGLAYTGEELIAQNHYREYMPGIGRYNRVDPLYHILAMNVMTGLEYPYVGNNPLKRKDIKGLIDDGSDTLAGKPICDKKCRFSNELFSQSLMANPMWPLLPFSPHNPALPMIVQCDVEIQYWQCEIYKSTRCGCKYIETRVDIRPIVNCHVGMPVDPSLMT
jgi:RHS repeat-associated protein